MVCIVYMNETGNMYKI